MGADQRQGTPESVMNIRTLTAADISFGLRLTAQNRWNQLEADWRRQLELEPNGCFLAQNEDGPIGTACCCVFDDVAWINLVLVDQALRGKGVGTRLMRHVLDYLQGRGVATIRLDATPLGQPIYEKLGFVGDFTLTRYEGVMRTESPEVASVVFMTRDDLLAVCRLDRAITQTSREKLMRRLLQDGDETRAFISNSELKGYYLARPGANAWKIGPIQGSVEAGAALLRDAAGRFANKRVYLDVPVDNAAAVAMVQELGLSPQRPFLRMTLGRRLREDLTQFWSSFGPEKG
jgi:GNAT superfamily N-acetyltransferase